MLAFDLDPGPPATIVECCRVALLLRELFAGFGLRVLPEELRVEGDAGVRAAQRRRDLRGDEALRADAWPRRSSAREPDLVVSRMTKSLRAGKVFVDWSQNTVVEDDGRRLLAARPRASRPPRPR